MIRVELPYPDSRLNPNARRHWAANAPVKADAKRTAYILTRAALCADRASWPDFAGDAPILFRVTFHPPDRRRRDDDNAIAALKSARDGIADALGVDDRRFRAEYRFADPRKPGCVIVEIG